MVQPTTTRISAADYFDLPEYAQHTLIQLIGGEVVVGMPPIIKHQRIAREIFVFIVLLARQKGGEAFGDPTEVYLDENNVFQPDIIYIKPDATITIDEKRVVGGPDLVVEVLSPSTAKYDRVQKYNAYEANGVGEYWIVDPVHGTVEVWTQGATGFDRQGAYAGDDTFKSRTLDEDVAVKPFFNG
jgi:Uma2 family endonuclease